MPKCIGWRRRGKQPDCWATAVLELPAEANVDPSPRGLLSLPSETMWETWPLVHWLILSNIKDLHRRLRGKRRLKELLSFLWINIWLTIRVKTKGSQSCFLPPLKTSSSFTWWMRLNQLLTASTWIKSLNQTVFSTQVNHSVHFNSSELSHLVILHLILLGQVRFVF